MNAILKIEEITVRNNEPTIQDLRLAELLGFGRDRDIRPLIQRNMPELQRYGEVSATVAETEDGISGTAPQNARGRGRPGVEYWLNEGQALLVAIKSDAKNSPEVREQIIRVFLAWRRGESPQRGAYVIGPPLPEIDIQHAPLAAKVGLLHLILKARGREAMLAYMELLNLPPVPALPADDAPLRCLAHLLDWKLELGTLGEALLYALQGDAASVARCLAMGVRVEDGFFVVANSHPAVLKIYRATAWKPHYRQLRRVEGAEEAEVAKYGKGLVSRGVRIPAFYIDAETVH